MRSLRPLFAIAAAVALAAPARAATSITSTFDTGTINSPVVYAALPTIWKCVKASGGFCGANELANGWYKQVVILPAGFAEADRAAFWSEFDKMVVTAGDAAKAGSSWTVTKKSQILYVGHFSPSGPLNTASAIFGAKVAPHPVRGYALSLSQNAVYAKVDQIRADIPNLRPFGVGVLFNTFQDEVTANAAPPSFVNRAFGIAKWTRLDLARAYVPVHELAHCALNFLDEYVEAGFQDLSIRQIDIATPLLLWNGTWGGFVNAIADLLGVYDYNVSEMLANNGNDNITTSAWPTTVYTPGFPSQNYVYEGGMFFGRGTFHQQGDNLMDGGSVNRGPGDGFAYAHSSYQQQVINNAFGAVAPRPNDRLRNAGPKNGWPLAFGATTRVMLFDGDKNHHFHPTQSYTVQVGWYERYWKTCWKWGFIPYPCYDDVWTTAQRGVAPAYRALDLKVSAAWSLAKLAQKVVCAVGINEVSSGGGTVRLCDQNIETMGANFLPTVSIPVPYQDVSVPASQWFTTYWWRFKTANGRADSGFTGWSSFYRSL